MEKDESSLRRQWAVLRRLCSRHYGLTVRAMACDQGVSEKTIRRDLETFRQVGFLLEETVGEFGRKTWRIAGTSGVPELSFNFDEVVALYLGHRLLQRLAGSMCVEATDSAYDKVRGAFGPRALEYLDRFAGYFHHRALGVRNYEAKSDLIESLKLAIEDTKVAHLLYQSERATEPAFRDVHPYGLTLFNACLYLIAFDPDADKVKHYKLDRIEEVEVSPFPFRRPADFNVSAHLAHCFGIYHVDGEVMTIKVRFAPSVARYVLEATDWPGCQERTKQRDGSLLAVFHLSSTTELKAWLLSFGAGAEVLEPERLRDEIRHELEALLAVYRSPPRSSSPRDSGRAGLARPSSETNPIRK